MSAHTNLTHDQICAALYGLGASHLVWNVLPDEHDDHGLAIDALHLEDATGTTVGWFAQVCEDGAYDLADEISDEPGTYVLSLPDGAWSHSITGFRDPSDPRFLNLDSHEV